MGGLYRVVIELDVDLIHIIHQAEGYCLITKFMLGVVGQHRLAAFLEQLAQGQFRLQICRQAISAHPLLKPQICFSRLDRANKGYLVPQDLASFLKDNGVYPSQQQLYILFRKLDSERIGQVSKKNFLTMVLTKECLARTEGDHLGLLPLSQRLPLQVEGLLAQLLQQAVFNHRLAQISRKDLQSSTDYSPALVMKVLDSDKDSKVTASEIDAFLKVSGKPLTQNAVQAIFKVLDSNGDKVIDQKQLKEALDPFDDYPYPGYSVAKRAQRINEELLKARAAKELDQQKILATRLAIQEESRLQFQLQKQRELALLAQEQSLLQLSRREREIRLAVHRDQLERTLQQQSGLLASRLQLERLHSEARRSRLLQSILR